MDRLISGIPRRPDLPPNDILSNGTMENELLVGVHSRRQPLVDRTQPGVSFKLKCSWDQKQPNLKLKTRPKQLLGSLPLANAYV